MDGAALLTIATALAVGVVAALVPVVTAEVYLAGVVSVVSGPVGMACAGALAVGQTIGKCVLFAGARRGRGWALAHGGASDPDGSDGGGEARWRSLLRRGTARPARWWAAARRRSSGVRRLCVLARRAAGEFARRTAGPRGALRRWGARALLLLDRPWPAAGVLLTSASLGLPPLAITSVAAGLRRTGPALFVGCTLTGRLVRFGLIAWGGIAVAGL